MNLNQLLSLHSYPLLLLLLGISILFGTFFPRLTIRWPLSQALFVMIIGGISTWLFFDVRIVNLVKHINGIEKLSELIVLISLFACGLKLKRPFSIKQWQNPLILLLIMMPLSIYLSSLLISSFLPLALASSFLLASALAPTDPVLAAEIQTGPLDDNAESEIQFSLTAEAGLNDAFAFPFVLLSLSMQKGAIASWQELLSNSDLLTHFFIDDVLFKIAVGICVGSAVGYVLTKYLFSKAYENKHIRLLEASSSIGVIFLSYGLTEVLNGYGFLSVFITSLTIRRLKNINVLHHEMFEFTEGLELLLSTVFMMIIGALCVSLLSEGEWTMPELWVALLLIFAIRPVLSIFSLVVVQIFTGRKNTFKTLSVISFFGVKGIGSIYYLSYALNHEDFSSRASLIRVMTLTILISALVHGISSRFLYKVAPTQKPKAADLAADI